MINFESRPQSNNTITNPCRRQRTTEYKIWHDKTKSRKKERVGREGAEIERASERRVTRRDKTGTRQLAEVRHSTDT